MTERLAWLAGIIDGEGTIGLAFYTRRSMRRGKPHVQRQLECWIAVANTNMRIIEAVSAVLSGCGIKHGLLLSQRGTAKWKPQWRVTVRGLRRCAATLALLRPYLVGKLPQADVILGLWDYRERGAFSRAHRLADDEWVDRQLGEIRHLNRRGPSPDDVTRPTFHVPIAVSGGAAGGKEPTHARRND